MNRLRNGDEIIVIAGKDKGRRGTIEKVLSNGRVVVQDINVVKKHQKGNPNAGVAGGIIQKEMPINASNVMVFNAATGKGDRIGYKTLDDGRKVRYFKSNNETLDQ
ncbi:MAG TPA: 50S ribosomal protein L24 [Gammaproteobacteria bacterium]|nr:50S ribosomal protein L24 [Gammaproteobacteria bacterium]